MAITISILSQKGGTGKTTMTRTLADVFGRLGLDVLAIDADPQGNLSDYFDTDPNAEPTLAEVITGHTRAAEAVHGQVIPANLRLAEAELALAGKIGREVTLRNALRDLKREREVILIDCPPTLGLLTVNALVAADYAMLSTQAQYFSLQGVEQAMEVVNLAKDSLNPDLELLGIVLNIANMRTKHARQTLESLREQFGDKLFRSVIRQSVAYAESAERAVP
ncbi:MAG: AAA family ATPase, partial [Actinomycetota bacterium]|nr:AAA family ATPase [Actinomycetota bacterium]